MSDTPQVLTTVEHACRPAPAAPPADAWPTPPGQPARAHRLRRSTALEGLDG
ncbi:hypothetical protein J2S46_001195 [Kitasatospora herbaricolor]|nr:hypothetical protein [Kitasatospora herbaricolor]